MTQPESRLSQTIQRKLKASGAYVWKVWGNELTPSGTPDICGVFRGQFIAFETKMPGNKCSAIQEYRIERIRMAGGLVVAPCYTIDQALDLIRLIDDTLDQKTEAAKTRGWRKLHEAYGRGANFA